MNLREWKTSPYPKFITTKMKIGSFNCQRDCQIFFDTYEVLCSLYPKSAVGLFASYSEHFELSSKCKCIVAHAITEYIFEKQNIVTITPMAQSY